jgi:hypothetical protein
MNYAFGTLMPDIDQKAKKADDQFSSGQINCPSNESLALLLLETK